MQIMVKFGLHPFIYTLLKFTLAQYIESIESGAETPRCSLQKEKP